MVEKAANDLRIDGEYYRGFCQESGQNTFMNLVRNLVRILSGILSGIWSEYFHESCQESGQNTFRDLVRNLVRILSGIWSEYFQQNFPNSKSPGIKVGYQMYTMKNQHYMDNYKHHIIQFFEFYRTFNFEKYAVCPFTGNSTIIKRCRLMDYAMLAE
jgi:hypothetical protein